MIAHSVWLTLKVASAMLLWLSVFGYLVFLHRRSTRRAKR